MVMTNTLPDFDGLDRERALNALKIAAGYIRSEPNGIVRDALTLLERISAESARIQQANASLVMALIRDEDAPSELFKPWASVRRFRDWRDAGRLRVVVKHGRCCCRPTDFFAHWRTLPDQTLGPQSL